MEKLDTEWQNENVAFFWSSPKIKRIISTFCKHKKFHYNKLQPMKK